MTAATLQTSDRSSIYVPALRRLHLALNAAVPLVGLRGAPPRLEGLQTLGRVCYNNFYFS